MMCEGALYVDTCLPFGLRSAPNFFTAIADAVEWIVRQEEASGITHNLDDFLVVGASNSLERAATLTTLLRVFDQLGLPVAREKLERPLSCLVFELDSEAMIIHLPQLKLKELQFHIKSWVGRQSCIKKDLESLVGKLAALYRAHLSPSQSVRSVQDESRYKLGARAAYEIAYEVVYVVVNYVQY